VPGVPRFSKIATETWREYDDDYKGIARLSILKSNSQDHQRQFFIVVGTKTVHDAVAGVGIDATCIRDQRDMSATGSGWRLPKDMVISCSLDEVMLY